MAKVIANMCSPRIRLYIESSDNTAEEAVVGAIHQVMQDCQIVSCSIDEVEINHAFLPSTGSYYMVSLLVKFPSSPLLENLPPNSLDLHDEEFPHDENFPLESDLQ